MCLNYDRFRVCIILMSLIMVTFLYLGILSHENIRELLTRIGHFSCLLQLPMSTRQIIFLL